MKKFRFIIVAVLVMFFASDAAAKGRFGIIGGANFSQSNIKALSKDNITLYQAGLTYQAKLPLGFSIQPSLVYQAKGMQFNSGEISSILQDLVSYDFKMGYLELPVAVQWGVDLLILRPYLEVAPYIGCAVTKPEDIKWDNLNRFSYGVGLGGGIEVWKLQVSARYNWSMGPVVKGDVIDTALEVLKSEDLKKANFSGVTLSVALLF